MNWMPIETAPRDGRILGWNKADGVLVYQPYQYGSCRQFFSWIAVLDENDVFGAPTHWMSLPEPPEGA